MPSVTGYTATRMKEIEDSTVVSGSVVNGDLVLMRRDGTPILGGRVVGPQGPAGPPGGLGEAPLDGDFYGRKDGAWVASSFENAPTDGKKYAMLDGSWAEIDRPWTLQFTNATPSPPTGFSVGDLAVGESWEVNMYGSGKEVHYDMRFRIMGSLIDSDAKMTFPSNLRPVLDHKTVALLADNRSNYLASGNGLAIFSSSTGQLSVVRGQSGVITLASIPGPTAVNFVGSYAADLVVDTRIVGSYTRAVDSLPDTAVWV